MSRTVADFMTPEPVVVSPQMPLSEAIQLLVERRVSGLPVLAEDGELVGILSESDLMWQEAGVDPPPYIMLLDSAIYLRNPARFEQELHKSLGQTVGDVMSRKPLTIKPDRPLREAAQLMHDKNIRRLPVVNERNHVVGILTQGDIVRALAAS